MASLVLLAHGVSSPPLASPCRKPNLHYTSWHSQLGDKPTSRAVSITRRRVILCRSNNSQDPKESSSAFFDENFVVRDMDGYLNYLSLEYDSVWDTKPSWCQPWTITLTGVSTVTLSWIVSRSLLVTAIASSLVCAWWYIFLIAYPKEYEDMIAKRRKVTECLEDTYGSEIGR